jgi:hypothetical protein
VRSAAAVPAAAWSKSRGEGGDELAVLAAPPLLLRLPPSRPPHPHRTAWGVARGDDVLHVRHVRSPPPPGGGEGAVVNDEFRDFLADQVGTRAADAMLWVSRRLATVERRLRFWLFTRRFR